MPRYLTSNYTILSLGALVEIASDHWNSVPLLVRAVFFNTGTVTAVINYKKLQ